MLKERTLIVLCTLLLCVGFLGAQQRQDRLQAVLPWVSKNTVWVAMASIDGIDLDAAGKWINNAAAQSVDPGEVESARNSMAQGITFVRGLREELKATGVKEVYCVFDGSAIANLFLVIPAGTNAEAVAAKLRPLVPRPALSVEQNAVVIQIAGPKADRKAPADRPDLVAAVAGRDAPVVLAISLPQELRLTIPPALPEPMGGGDLSPIQDGFMWSAIELRFTPEPALYAVAQMDGAANATAAVELMRTTLEAKSKAGGREAEFFAAAGKWLLPQAKEDLLVIDLTSAKLNEAVAQIAPSYLRQARQNAKQIQSMSQMRQLLLGVQMFASENRAAPERLEQLEKFLGGPANMQRLMTNPQRPEKKPGYVYLKQPMDGDGTSQKVVLYEAYDTWLGGINVGYGDGHVERIENEATFLAQLKASGGSK